MLRDVTRWVLLGLLLVVSAAASAQPGYAFHDLPTAVVHSDPGRTSLSFRVREVGWEASIARAVTARLEISATASPDHLFDLEARFLVIKDLLPLNVAVDGAAGRVRLLATLYLGPVHIDAGRTWGRGPCRWGTVQLSAHPALCLLVGLEERIGRVAPIAAIRWYPGKAGLWGISVLIRREGLEILVGGTM
jgi:hypothetical protein